MTAAREGRVLGVGEPDLALRLELPPTVNKLYVPVAGRLKKRRASETWAAAACMTVRLDRAGRSLPYRFHARIVLPDSRADIDGRIKPLLDACQAGGAIANDKHCRRLVVEIDDTREGTALIELWATDDIPPQRRAPARKRDNARMEQHS